ncbi:MAG TPA: Do family serine endopeptidase, partial [Thermoanaerobaculia bacterium]|nr:Do family serine endopeptidase [Thermoanaerobaculia bacterium]
MRTKTKVLSLAALLAGSVVFGMILAGSLDLTRLASAQKAAPAAAPAASSAPAHGPGAVLALPSFADIAEQIAPAIVSVTATDIVKAKQFHHGYHNFGGDGQDPFEFFFGPDNPHKKGSDDDEDQKQLSGGTGFIIEPDGYILTNNHVIEGADKVEVKVGDRDEYKAKIVGTDPATDLALLKIEGTKPFPTVRLGDSDKIRVGEWVMAIGDPLNFDKSVTVGVISGKGRYAGLSRATSAFENLLQTDAAINFGNSGGPLVNVSGEVVGINTAISRFAQNIGFAVPVNVARRLLPQLKKGKVVRGFLGVNIESVNRKWQEAYGLKSPEGALVQSVEKGKPADKAGIRYGDIVTRVDDVAVKNNRDLIDYVSSKSPGSKITIGFIRDGKEQTTVATLETRPEDGERPPATDEEEGAVSRQKMLGLDLDDLTPRARRAYGIDRDTAKGVVVTHVKPVSPAADANLQEGDVILEVNGTAVGSVDEMQAAIKKAPKGKYVRFYVQRQGP